MAAEHPPLPPEVIELEAVTVEGERIREEKVKEIEAGSQKFQEELERRGRPERTEISETRDNYGNRKVKVRTRFLTYCFEAPDAATRRNELGENFTLPTNCDDDN